MRDVGIDKMFRKIYYNDFSEEVLQQPETFQNMEEISKYDRMLWTIIEKGTKKVDTFLVYLENSKVSSPEHL